MPLSDFRKQSAPGAAFRQAQLNERPPAPAGRPPPHSGRCRWRRPYSPRCPTPWGSSPAYGQPARCLGQGRPGKLHIQRHGGELGGAVWLIEQIYECLGWIGRLSAHLISFPQPREHSVYFSLGTPLGIINLPIRFCVSHTEGSHPLRGWEPEKELGLINHPTCYSVYHTV